MTRFPRFWLRRGAASHLLTPLALLFAVLARLRRFLYRHGFLRRYRPPVPVVIVGNIFIGGTGKTPVVIWLADYLHARGWRPGIITRGYGGRSGVWPLSVSASTDPALAGDEPVLIAARAQCPVVADPDRCRGASYLLANYECDILISDDGLQHYRLQRDLELVVLDGERGLGNGRCLPAGPLREPPSRLQQVDLVLANGRSDITTYQFNLQALGLQNFEGGYAELSPDFAPDGVHAVAGIGNPARFFSSLRAAGLEVVGHAFADHHRYTAQDLQFDHRPIIMTEKDAVKCRSFGLTNAWFVPVQASFSEEALRALDTHEIRLRRNWRKEHE